MVCVANVNDSKAELFLMQMLKEILCNTKGILADGVYREELAEQVKKFYGYLIKVVMRTDNETDEFKQIN